MPFDFTTARMNMLDGQIRPNKVNDSRLLDALQQLPRENFVAQPQKAFAYTESEIEATAGRNLMAPMVLARMIEALDLQPNMAVLDIAPATGYSSAVMAALCKAVVGLDTDATLAAQATQICQNLAVANVQFVHGPLSMGAKNFAPYDAIFINGAVADVPRTLFHQLAEGGKLIAIIAPNENVLGQATLFTKFHSTINDCPLFEASASYLAGFAPHEEFLL